MHIVFVPGGPGFSSLQEERELGPRFGARGWSASFWNEPWRADPGVPVSWATCVDALVRLLESVRSEPLTVVAHSVAVHVAVAAVAALKPSRCRLVLIAPALDIQVNHQAVVKLAAKGLSITAPVVARQMMEAASRSRSFFDEEMKQALGMAATDQTLFSRYWCDRAAFLRFTDVLNTPGGAFDLNAFVAVLSDLRARHWTLPAAPPTCEIGTVVGASDPVVDVEQMRAALARWHPRAQMKVFEGCGHWLHLEAPERFCAFLEGASA